MAHLINRIQALLHKIDRSPPCCAVSLRRHMSNCYIYYIMACDLIYFYVLLLAFYVLLLAFYVFLLAFHVFLFAFYVLLLAFYVLILDLSVLACFHKFYVRLYICYSRFKEHSCSSCYFLIYVSTLNKIYFTLSRI